MPTVGGNPDAIVPGLRARGLAVTVRASAAGDHGATDDGPQGRRRRKPAALVAPAFAAIAGGGVWTVPMATRTAANGRDRQGGAG